MVLLLRFLNFSKCFFALLIVSFPPANASDKCYTPPRRILVSRIVTLNAARRDVGRRGSRALLLFRPT